MSCARLIQHYTRGKSRPDQGAVAIQSGFLSTKALIPIYGCIQFARARNVQTDGNVGARHSYLYDRWRSLHACMRICAVTTAKPFALEEDEPQRVAEAVRRMKLKHVVITAVARDDLKDGGADHFAHTITAIREMDLR